MKNLLVSIIIPCYNAVQYIDRCFNSVAGQTYDNIEIIMVNDGSTDETLEILKKYQQLNSKVKIIDQKNSGCGAARNAGIRQSTGDFVFLVDSDDWLSKTAIESLVSAQAKNDAEMTVGKVMRVTSKNKSRPYHIMSSYRAGVSKSHYMRKNFPNAWNVLYKKSFLLRFNYYFLERSFLDDASFIIFHLMKVNKIEFINEFTYMYFENINSISHFTTYKKWHVESTLVSVEQLLKNLQKDGHLTKILQNRQDRKNFMSCFSIFYLLEKTMLAFTKISHKEKNKITFDLFSILFKYNIKLTVPSNWKKFFWGIMIIPWKFKYLFFRIKQKK